jgi:hypothetical protein
MAIDASIPLGVRPVQIENPMNAMARVLQIKQAQQEGELGAMKMDEYRRGVDETNKLSQIYSGAMGADGSIDRNKLFSGVASGGMGHKIPALQKSFTESDKATGELDAQKFKLANERYSIFQKTMGALKDAPNLSKDMVTRTGQSMVQQGILPMEIYQKAVADMPDDPVQLRQRLLQGLSAQMSPEQIFTVFAPKAEKIDNGQQISFRDTNPNSPTYGQATGGAAVQKQADPGAMLSAQTARRGQDLADARSRESTTATMTKPFEITGEDGKPILVQQDKQGNI